MRTILLLVFCLAAVSTSAQVYRSVDKNGNVIFSDKPAPNSKRIYVPPVQTITAPKPAASKKDAATPGAGVAPEAKVKQPKVVRYKLSIASPQHDQTIRQNDGMLAVSVSVQPPLQQGDLIQFSLNGQPAGKPSASPSTTLPFVDRGSHSIGAKIVSSTGATKATAKTVTVHLKRFFVTN